MSPGAVVVLAATTAQSDISTTAPIEGSKS